MKKRYDWYKIIQYAFLIIFTFLIIYPVAMVIIGSFRDNISIMTNPFGFPNKLDFTNYVKAWVNGTLYALYKNSIIVTLFSVLLIGLFSSMIAFVMSRHDFKLKKLIFPIIIIGMTIPFQVGIIPVYLQMSRFKLVDTYPGLIILYIVNFLSYSTYITYGFFRKVPVEIQEAAGIDGCGNFRLYANIIMPLSTSIITTVLISNLMFVWNDMFFSLVMMRSKLMKTLTVGLLSFKGQYQSDYATMFAGIVLVSIPMIIIFLLLQKRFIEGISSGAVKG
jgi:ABC-type sugar transport system, permease component